MPLSSASFRFYEELNDFLPRVRRKQQFSVHFKQRNSIKDMIESLGVPHTEVDLILVNGESVDFSYIVQAGDQISVYPVFESLDISSLNRLRPAPLRNPRFVLDIHLGKLSRYLRLLGFDTLYSNSYTDKELAALSAAGDKRILLTRDHGLLKHKQITHGYFVRATDPDKQIREILDRFDLRHSVKPFIRCMRCNALIRQTEKEAVAGRLPGKVAQQYDEFSCCPGCGRVYWQGGHYLRLKKIIARLVND